MSLSHTIYWVTLFSIIFYILFYQGICCVVTITRQPVTANISQILTSRTKRASIKKRKKDLTSNGPRGGRRALDISKLLILNDLTF